MSIQVATHQVGDVSVVDVAGRITHGEGASMLHGAIPGALRPGRQ